jgi:hypothetical protein
MEVRVASSPRLVAKSVRLTKGGVGIRDGLGW